MTKRNGITIRLGASYDTVSVHSNGSTNTFDRAQMRKDGNKKLVRRLNQEVVDAYCAEHGLNKDRRSKRRERKLADKRRAA